MLPLGDPATLTVRPSCSSSCWARMLMWWTLVLSTAGASVCNVPRVGPMLNLGQCESLQKCQLCSAVCDCGGQGQPGGSCIGQSSAMACLGEEDPIRDASEQTFSIDVANSSRCNASAATGDAKLYFRSRCGAEVCCPTEPFVPASCQDSLDVDLRAPGQCADLIQNGLYSCKDSFCPTCSLAGKCDRTCRFGACAVCGDCWRGTQTSSGGPELCDDGNDVNGDGCSSSCTVEEGWNCSRVQHLVIGQGTVELDECHTCVDHPMAWFDAQGYTCEDYTAFAACDVGSQSTDPLVRGGRLFETPSYHSYKFAYELDVREAKPLFLLISVTADANAHLFIGDPMLRGFEVVIGGWNNGISMIRRYPGTQALAHHYGQVLETDAASHFWLRYDHHGNLSVGLGHEIGQQIFLDGAEAAVAVQQAEAWTSEGASTLQLLSIATGWQSAGSWDLRLRSGAVAPSIGELTNQGLDATHVCCSCGGGAYGRPCELQASGAAAQEPRIAAPTVAPTPSPTSTPTRRLFQAQVLGDPSFLGPVTPAGFTMHLHLDFCSEVLDACQLDAIVLPAEVSDRILLPLSSIWSQIRNPSCRLQSHSLLGNELRWQAFDCDMSAGASYVVAVHLQSDNGADTLYRYPVDVGKPPDTQPRAVVVDDIDPVPGLAAGRVTLKAAADESGILQYRLFWGVDNGMKVDNPDPLSTLVTVVNTYVGGGFRNEFSNECLFSDCHWELFLAKSSRRRVRYALKHQVTGECLCYSQKELSVEACPSEVLSLDAAETYMYINNGEGMLVSRNPPQNQIYMLAMYRDFGSDFEESKARLEAVCSALASCVGIFLNTNPTHNQYLEGGFLYDRSVYTDAWPPVMPSSFPASASKALFAYADSTAQGPPATDRTSLNVEVDRAWHHFQSYRKALKAPACLWTLETRIINSTVESRFVNDYHYECLCQVPQRPSVAADGETTEAPTGSSATALMMTTACDGTAFNFIVGGEASATKGFCEWSSYPADPRAMAVSSLDAQDNVTTQATWNTAGGVWDRDLEGVAIWNISGGGKLDLLSPYTVANEHTHIAWVRLVGFQDLANLSAGQEAARVTIFSGTRSGLEESCLQLSQRAAVDDRHPFCPVDPCIDSLLESCCSENATTTCNCNCPAASPMTEEVASAFGTALSGDHWSLGLKACASATVWDSGADLTVPTSGDSGWVLLAAVGSGTSDGSGETVLYALTPSEPEILSWQTHFGCSDPGCTAIAKVRDLPRGGSRTCALSVNVYITDFLSGINSGSPEVVESISVRGGIPEMTREIRRDCHPDGTNEHNRLFPCVHRYGVDDFVSGSNASRVLRVEAKISTGVDDFPRMGEYLSGEVTIECRRTAARDRRAPTSGSLERVGVAARTCGGSVLQAVGGSSAPAAPTPPSASVAQAWAWSRQLTEEELWAVFHATRTRYAPDYEVFIHGRHVVRPAREVVASGQLRCRDPGCSARATISGLPADMEALCLLTVAVAITDFSSDSESLEYVRLDGVEVVTHCQIEQDAETSVRHLCADHLDVSPRVLRAAFLNDGQVQVEAKITDEVNKFYTSDNWLLDANVEIHCTSTEVQETKFVHDAVVIAPHTTRLVAVSSSEQGEGGRLAGTFTDTVNGFVDPPRIIDLSNGALHLTFTASNAEGALWATVVDRQHRDVVTVQEITAGGLGHRDLCPGSHRRRGQQTARRFLTDPYLTNCEFEPGVPYSVLLYIDQNEEPWGSGWLYPLDFIGPARASSSLTPQLKARWILFEDTDSSMGRITGTVTIGRAYSEENITSYLLSFGAFGTVEGSILATVAASGAQEYLVSLQSVMIPFSANTLLVCTANDHGTSSECRQSPITDIALGFVSLPTITASSADPRYLQAALEMTELVSARVDLAIVPEGAEVDARPTSDHRALDYNVISRAIVCEAPDRQFDAKSAVITIGPCDLSPGERYSLVVLVAVRVECPCTAPCVCQGALSTTVAGNPESSIRTTELGYFIPPDTAAPTLALACDADCPRDRRFDLDLELDDVGRSYPILVKCAACVAKEPAASDTSGSGNSTTTAPSGCIRNKDSEAHQHWRVLLPSGGSCLSSLGVSELQFFRFEEEDEDGRLVSGTPAWGGVPLLPNESSQHAFDQNANTSFNFQPDSDFWLGLDLGAAAAIYRARLHWSTAWADADCPGREAHLEWSDDGSSWTWRASVPAAPSNGHHHTDLFVDVSSPGWDNNTIAQAAFNGETKGAVFVNGLNPRTVYSVHCLALDSAGNSQTTVLQGLRTSDETPPNLHIASATATDFTVRTAVTVVDPGKHYPVLTSCIVRDKNASLEQPLPAVEQLDASAQRCHHIEAPASPVNDGRIRYQVAFRARLQGEQSALRFSQRSWGRDPALLEPRKEERSCGLRHRPRAGPGGCGAPAGRRERLALQLLLRGHGEAYLFIGPGERAAIGYEIVIGGWSNSAAALRKGASLDPQNVDLQISSTVASHSSTGLEPSALDPLTYRAFWLTADPVSGWIRIGLGKYIGLRQIMEYQDPDPVVSIDNVMIGAGYHSQGSIHHGVSFIICPDMGNLALHRPAFASSTSFGATADKLTDGEAGDGHFCEYCHTQDPRHVCAQTRRQSEFFPPYLRVDLGAEFSVGAVRIVGPSMEDDGRPEQAQQLTVHVGFQGFGADPLCARVEDARGDHVYECYRPLQGSWVSILGDSSLLAGLPEAFGIRLCEIEVYEYWRDILTTESAVEVFYRQPPVRPVLPVDGQAGEIVVHGLFPNREYQLFCYGEDLGGQGGLSNLVEFRTPDTTPPQVQMLHVQPANNSITVAVHLEDPGEAYPAIAKCAATVGGESPPQHDHFFVHRFWRVRLLTHEALDPGCSGHILLRRLSFRDLLGEELPGLTFNRQSQSQGASMANEGSQTNQSNQTNGTNGTNETNGSNGSNQTQFGQTGQSHQIYGFNDEDGDGLGETPELPKWALVPEDDPWIALDTEARTPQDLLAHAAGAAAHGDLLILLDWSASAHPLEMEVNLPGGGGSRMHLAARSAGGGIYDVSCAGESSCGGTYVESAAFPLAPTGQYRVSMRRRDGQAAEAVNITVIVRVCGQETVQNQRLEPDRDDLTLLPVGTFDTFGQGCARGPRHQHSSWQSSEWRGTIPGATVDGDLSSCVETGGEGRTPTDDRATFRLELGQTRHVEAIWILGMLQGEHVVGVPAQHVDVYIAQAGETQLERMSLCASAVPLGNIAMDISALLDLSMPARSVRCATPVKGSHLVLVANPPGRALSICELELQSTPDPVVSKLEIQWGGANQSAASCSANNVSVEWSDDNMSWHELWRSNASRNRDVQEMRWSWWHRLFALNFSTNFSKAGTGLVTITHLQEDVSYDIYCWASDALGNGIARDLVSLDLPWADTQIPGETDEANFGLRRRLTSGDLEGDRVWCNEAIMEFFPCEEQIITADDAAPQMTRSSPIAFVSTAGGVDQNASETLSWDMDMSDPSCVKRKGTRIRCSVRCTQSQIETGAAGSSSREDTANVATAACSPPSCAEQTWTNGVTSHFSFSKLQPGRDYQLRCQASDPWGNTQGIAFAVRTPDTSTPAPTTSSTYVVRRRRATTPYFAPTTTQRSNSGGGAGSNDDSGWVLAIQSTTTAEVSPAPLPWPTGTPAPSPSSTPVPQWSPSRPGRHTTTTAHSTAPGPLLPPSGGGGAPTRLQANLILAMRSSADAELLQWPGAVAAIVSAMRDSLELTGEESVQVLEMLVVPPAGRRLEDTAALPWQVRLRLLVTTSRQAFEGVFQRLSALGGSTPSSPGEVFLRHLQEGLLARGLGGLPSGSLAVLATQVWQEGELPVPLASQEELPSTSQAPRWSDDPQEGDPAQWGRNWQAPDDSSSTGAVVLPLVGTALGAITCALMGVVCMLWVWPHCRQRSTAGATPGGKRRDVPVGSAHPTESPPLHKIAWQQESAEKPPTPASTCSTTTVGSAPSHLPAAGVQLRQSSTAGVNTQPSPEDMDLWSWNSHVGSSNSQEVPVSGPRSSSPVYSFMPQTQLPQSPQVQLTQPERPQQHCPPHQVTRGQDRRLVPSVPASWSNSARLEQRGPRGL